MSYNVIHNKINTSIKTQREEDENVHIGFVCRNSENKEEMNTCPLDFCKHMISINPFNCISDGINNSFEFFIHFDTDCECCVTQIETLLGVKKQFDDPTTRSDAEYWTAFIILDNGKLLFEMDLKSIEFSPNNRHVAIKCFIDET